MSFDSYSSSILKNSFNCLETFNCENLDIIDKLLYEFEEINKPLKDLILLNEVISLRIYKEQVKHKDSKVRTSIDIGLSTEGYDTISDYAISNPEAYEDIKYSCKIKIKKNKRIETILITFASVFTINNFYGKLESDTPLSTRVYYVREGRSEKSYGDNWADEILNNKSLISNLSLSRISTSIPINMQKIQSADESAVSGLFYSLLVDPSYKFTTQSNEDYACSVNTLLNIFKKDGVDKLGIMRIWHRNVDDEDSSFSDIPGGGNSYDLEEEHFRHNSVLSAIRELIEESSYLLTLGNFSLKYLDVSTDYRPAEQRNAVYLLGQISFSETTPLLKKLYSSPVLNYQFTLPDKACERNVYKSIECGNEVVGHFNNSLLEGVIEGFKLANKAGYSFNQSLKALENLDHAINNSSVLELADFEICKIMYSSIKEGEIFNFLNFLNEIGYESKTNVDLARSFSLMNSLESYAFVNKILNIGRVHKHHFNSEKLKNSYYDSVKNQIQELLVKITSNKQEALYLDDILVGLAAFFHLHNRCNTSMNDMFELYSSIFTTKIRNLNLLDFLIESKICSNELITEDNSSILSDFKDLFIRILNDCKFSELTIFKKYLVNPLVHTIYNLYYVSMLYEMNDLFLEDLNKRESSMIKLDVLSKYYYHFTRKPIEYLVKNIYEKSISVDYVLTKLSKILKTTDSGILTKYFDESQIVIIKPETYSLDRNLNFIVLSEIS